MIDVGDTYPASVTIRDATGTLANATEVTVTVTRPDGTLVGPQLVLPTTTGVYDYDFPTTTAGRHVLRWVAIGQNAATHSETFEVTPADAGQIISLADLKAHLNITRSDNDDELRLYAQMASEVVEAQAGPILPRLVTETVSARGGIALLGSSRVLSIVSTDNGTTPTVTAWGELSGLPYWGATTVTYRAGMATIPAPVRMAALEIASGLWRTQRGPAPLPFQASGQQTEGATLQYASLISAVARELLAPYVSVGTVV